MRILEARNAHEALPWAIQELNRYGIKRPSRNGPVIQMPEPYTTVYERPTEKVTFWKSRDYNIFFNIYEALWMLSGRNDVAPLTRYVKDFGRYSDDGNTLHGAYGRRWRSHFGFDQLKVIAERLTENQDDRRSVLSMWDALCDLDRPGKDVPCNDMATFQINTGRLDMVVFCRSNDMVWGTYFANAFHFGVLLEYMAAWIGVPVGTYTQVSVNFHAYTATLEPIQEIADFKGGLANYLETEKWPYVQTLPLVAGDIREFNRQREIVLKAADEGVFGDGGTLTEPSLRLAYYLLNAHHIYKTVKDDSRYVRAFEVIGNAGYLDGLSADGVRNDWVKAAHIWIERRREAHDAK